MGGVKIRYVPIVASLTLAPMASHAIPRLPAEEPCFAIADDTPVLCGRLVARDPAEAWLPHTPHVEFDTQPHAAMGWIASGERVSSSSSANDAYGIIPADVTIRIR
jgi:hypothetical protein